MTPEEIEETINGMQEPAQVDPAVEIPTSVVASPSIGRIQQLSGSLIS
jgi:hypothetical protein